jgi:serine/threonine protein kinase
MKLEPNKIVNHYNENLARKMLRDVLLGLEYRMFMVCSFIVHYQKIIHRDIKPENLLLTEDFSVVIGDFGISHTFENEEAAVDDTNASPAFSPPEAFNGIIKYVHIRKIRYS